MMTNVFTFKKNEFNLHRQWSWNKFDRFTYQFHNVFVLNSNLQESQNFGHPDITNSSVFVFELIFSAALPNSIAIFTFGIENELSFYLKCKKSSRESHSDKLMKDEDDNNDLIQGCKTLKYISFLKINLNSQNFHFVTRVLGATILTGIKSNDSNKRVRTLRIIFLMKMGGVRC